GCRRLARPRRPVGRLSPRGDLPRSPRNDPSDSYRDGLGSCSGGWRPRDLAAELQGRAPLHPVQDRAGRTHPAARTPGQLLGTADRRRLWRGTGSQPHGCRPGHRAHAAERRQPLGNRRRASAYPHRLRAPPDPRRPPHPAPPPANRWRRRWPSRIGGPDQSGTDQAVVQPGGRLIALDFADPAYALTGIQVTDVWLLDPATRHFRHLPDMPAAVQLKFTSMAWASDSRLVMLAQTSGPSGDRDLVAVWKPGQRQI